MMPRFIPGRQPWRCRKCGPLVPLWHYRDFSAFPFSGALGGHTRVICETGVDDAAVGWGHGLESDTPVGLGNPLGYRSGHLT